MSGCCLAAVFPSGCCLAAVFLSGRQGVARREQKQKRSRKEKQRREAEKRSREEKQRREAEKREAEKREGVKEKERGEGEEEKQKRRSRRGKPGNGKPGKRSRMFFFSFFFCKKKLQEKNGPSSITFGAFFEVKTDDNQFHLASSDLISECYEQLSCTEIEPEFVYINANEPKRPGSFLRMVNTHFIADLLNSLLCGIGCAWFDLRRGERGIVSPSGRWRSCFSIARRWKGTSLKVSFNGVSLDIKKTKDTSAWWLGHVA